MTTATPLLSIYQLRVILGGISPLIWRRVLVHRETTLAHLHTILQILFAWSDEHLHSFHIHGREYGSSGAPTCSVRLRDFYLHCGERFRYVYDFGAHWECEIRLEALLPLASRRIYPVCIGGKRAAPPEDCWGAWGYLERLAQHRLYPPLEAMQVVAEAISTLLAADPQTSVRAALGDLDDLHEAVDCLERYQAGSVIKTVNLCFRAVAPRVDSPDFAMGNVAKSLIHSVCLLDALSKAKVINEAAPLPH